MRYVIISETELLRTSVHQPFTVKNYYRTGGVDKNHITSRDINEAHRFRSLIKARYICSRLNCVDKHKRNWEVRKI